MKKTFSTYTVTENRLIRVTWKNGKLTRQGKRVGKDCPIDYLTRRTYVLNGKTAAICHLRTIHNLSLSDAIALLNRAE